MSEPTVLQRTVWDTVLRVGTQLGAAKELGMTQGAVRSHLLAYAHHTGHTGPIPGFRTLPPAFAGTPTRTERRLQRIEGKLDALLARIPPGSNIIEWRPDHRRIEDDGVPVRTQRRRAKAS